MAKSNVEDSMAQAIRFLIEIEDAVRLKQDDVIKKLAPNAKKHADNLKNAKQEIHTHWNE